MDKTLEAPALYHDNKYYTECFISKDRLIKNIYDERLYQYEKVNTSESAISTNAYAAICPDFLLNQPYYNQIFNGSKFRLE